MLASWVGLGWVKKNGPMSISGLEATILVLVLVGGVRSGSQELGLGCGVGEEGLRSVVGKETEPSD